MSNFIRGENEVSFTYTSGTGVFNIAGRGSSLRWILWQNTSGVASGVVVSVMDTVSGTAASGLWLAGSGITMISEGVPLFISGVGGGAQPLTQRIEYGLTGVNSGLAVVISGGAANTVRALVGYIPGQD